MHSLTKPEKVCYARTFRFYWPYFRGTSTVSRKRIRDKLLTIRQANRCALNDLSVRANETPSIISAHSASASSYKLQLLLRCEYCNGRQHIIAIKSANALETL